jgi:hypothetical protein
VIPLRGWANYTSQELLRLHVSGATATCYAESIIKSQTTNVQRERDSMRLSEKSPSWLPWPYLLADSGARRPRSLRPMQVRPAHLTQNTMYTTALVHCPLVHGLANDHTLAHLPATASLVSSRVSACGSRCRVPYHTSSSSRPRIALGSATSS